MIELPIANNWVQSFGNNDDQIAGKKGSAHTGMIRHDDAEENNSFPVFSWYAVPAARNVDINRKIIYLITVYVIIANSFFLL